MKEDNTIPSYQKNPSLLSTQSAINHEQSKANHISYIIITQPKIIWENVCMCLNIKSEIVLLFLSHEYTFDFKTSYNKIDLQQTNHLSQNWITIELTTDHNFDCPVLALINQGYVLYLPNQKNNTQVRTCRHLFV